MPVAAAIGEHASMVPESCMRWMTEQIGRGSRIVSVRQLRLGGWHVNHAVDIIDSDGEAHQLVLRRWARPGWERDDPDYTAEREARVLGLLCPTAVPAPAVIATDAEGVRCDVPALLLSRLPGRPPPVDIDIDGFCRQLAEVLCQIHALDVPAEAGLQPYRLYYDRERARPARWMPATGVWTAATAIVRDPPPPTNPTMIHRDFHPENTLWSGGLLSGVVDWTQASRGPPGLDVGHMRWNLVVDHGPATADRFLASYRQISGRNLERQHYWDLVSLFDLPLDGEEPGDIEPPDLRRFEDYAKGLLTSQD